ncbi:hypothetical protein TrCOL_g12854 [Triparma columacea]|uniref:Methyltransferase n=1 Tax=Triparma columacea TaxID=722753 RepID=A0A9W7GF75_9STRA|nr:hypothetical protein TrCOL_g12854 [Triparma columacea]
MTSDTLKDNLLTHVLTPVLNYLPTPVSTTFKDLYASNPTSLVVLLLSSLLLIFQLFSRPISKSDRSFKSVTTLLNRGEKTNEDIDETVKRYEGLFTDARTDVGANTTEEAIGKRADEYKDMVSSFYDLVTDFYEYGWGQSFHFAPRFTHETFTESIYRAEHFLALKLGLSSSKKCVDVGCGVGGPMRNIARFTGADITGVTINEYQVKVGNRYCKEQGVDDICRSTQGDFQHLDQKFSPSTFDAAYQIEATCHSPNKTETFTQVATVLKPGGLFAGYEWVVLPENGYDSSNREHVRIKEGIEVGNGLPTLATGKQVKEALEKAGFEVLEAFDANRGQFASNEIPWYQTLKGNYTSLTGFRMSHVGRVCTHLMCTVLETLRVAPKGTVRVSSLLNATALDLVEGGEKQLFTPSYYFLARKR